MTEKILLGKKVNIRDGGGVGSNPSPNSKPPQIPGTNKGKNSAK